MLPEVPPPALDTLTPVLILGGKENSLAVTRNLGQLGIAVRVSGPANCWGMYSRYCRESFPLSPGANTADFWRRLLLSEDRSLDGHILFACSDDAIEFRAAHDEELSRRYILDASSPNQQLALLDKRQTLELAAKAGIDAPRYWTIKSEADVDHLERVAVFPLLVKPVHSHKFVRIFGHKLFIVENSLQVLRQKVALALSLGLEILVVEMIPGPDDLLSSYYTYVGADGRYLFHLTKRVLRRYPANRGNACYHITEWLPETAKAGRHFFDAISLRGLGNVEFKRDPRDGKLKLIEVNARFTAPHQLLVSAGAPLDLVAYCELTGQPVPQFDGYREFLRLWFPLRDFLSFLELRRRRQLSFSDWLCSLPTSLPVSALWRLTDPWPAAGAAGAIVQRLLRAQK
jgi:D-aspartate ligase